MRTFLSATLFALLQTGSVLAVTCDNRDLELARIQQQLVARAERAGAVSKIERLEADMLLTWARQCGQEISRTELCRAVPPYLAKLKDIAERELAATGGGADTIQYYLGQKLLMHTVCP